MSGLFVTTPVSPIFLNCTHFTGSFTVHAKRSRLSLFVLSISFLFIKYLNTAITSAPQSLQSLAMLVGSSLMSPVVTFGSRYLIFFRMRLLNETIYIS